MLNSNIVNLGYEEIQVSHNRKLVASLVPWKGNIRIDIRYWSKFRAVDQYVPLKAHGLFFKIDELKQLMPKIQALIDKSGQ
jgi:hypothetical protein